MLLGGLVWGKGTGLRKEWIEAFKCDVFELQC
jgi:hypothetical protein